MPRQFRTNAARQIVEQAGSDAVELVAELAEPLAEYLLNDYEREDWQDSPHVEALARVAESELLSGSHQQTTAA